VVRDSLFMSWSAGTTHYLCMYASYSNISYHFLLFIARCAVGLPLGAFALSRLFKTVHLYGLHTLNEASNTGDIT
jgi:hypothetical protein